MQTDRRQLLAFGAALGVAPFALQAPASQTPRPSRTRFAVNIEAWFAGTPFLEKFDRAKALGFTAVEFWPWRGKDLEGVRKKCDELDLEVAQFTAWGFTPGMNDPANHAAFVAEIEASCDTAKLLGAKRMTVVAGNDQPGMTQREMHDHVITALRSAAPIAEAHDVMLILEPMNIRVDHAGHCLYGSEDAVRICRAVDSTHVKINWDLYHMQISEGDLSGHLREGFDQVGYVQLADHPGRHEPGTGEIHYPRVLRELWDLGYRGPVGLECWPEGGDDARAAERVRAADVW
ncbi:MAG: TIM barrel protein [Planctomycetota bacterium]